MELSNRHFILAATDCFGYDVYQRDPLYKHIPLLINATPEGCVGIFSASQARGTYFSGSWDLLLRLVGLMPFVRRSTVSGAILRFTDRITADLTMVDFEDLFPWLLNPTAAGFRELMKLSLAYLDNCLKDVKAGFQPILAKIMQHDDRKEFFYAVQQQKTVTKYGEIWAQVMWLACMAVMCDPPSIAREIVLTHEQTEHATELLGVIDGIAAMISEEQSQQATDAIGQLSMAILRRESDIVNLIDDNSASLASQLLVPRTVNLLSIRLNGTFVAPPSRTASAAPSYIMLSRDRIQCRVPGIVDKETKRFLNPTGSTPYNYWVQVHGACRAYGSKHALPTITWATARTLHFVSKVVYYSPLMVGRSLYMS
ncbi:hypothetical protein V1520DRAFT_376052 [Lipomyces starkeyi]